MADENKPAEAKEAPKVETPLTPQELQETKSAVLSQLWGESAATAALEEKPKKDEKTAEKKEEPQADAPAADKVERPRGPDGKFLPDAGAAKEGAVAENDSKEGRRVVVKKKKAKGDEKDEPAAEAQPAPDVEETVRRVLDEKIPSNDQRGITPPEATSIDPADRDVLATLSAMEASNPRNKGIVARTRDFWKKEEGYQTQWEAAEQRRAGEEGREPVEFNPDGKEHAAWYARNEPKYDPNEFEATKDNIREQRLLQRAKDELRKEREEDPDVKEWKRERARAKHEPAVQEVVNHATVDLLASVPEFEQAMDDGHGSLILSADTEKKMAETNPALFDAANTEANRLAATLKELEYITRMPNDHQIDPKHRIEIDGVTVRPHADILDTHAELEQRVASAPRAKQMLGSQAFITSDDKRDRIDSIINNTGLNLDQKRAAIQRVNDTTWTIQPEDVRQFLVVKSKARVKAISEKHNKWGSAQKQDASQNGKTHVASNNGSEPVKSTAPPSGATASSSDSQDNAKNLSSASESQVDAVVKQMF